MTTTEIPSEKLTDLFDGNKSQWLPLYRRLLARFSKVQGVAFFPYRDVIAIGRKDDSRPTFGAIRVSALGLDVGLGLTKTFPKTERLRATTRSPKWITHHVILSKASDIDEEFFTWIKAARHQARTARPRST